MNEYIMEERKHDYINYEPEIVDADDMPHTFWYCKYCEAQNSCLDGECQYCNDYYNAGIEIDCLLLLTDAMAEYLELTIDPEVTYTMNYLDKKVSSMLKD